MGRVFKNGAHSARRDCLELENMQRYTKKMLLDIKQTHYNEAENEFSKYKSLIIGGNIGAYGRKFIEIYTDALVNIIKDIFNSEKKVLSRFTSFPNTQYFVSLKKEVLDIANREIFLLDEKLENQQQPYAIGLNTIPSSIASPLDRLRSSIRDRIDRAADQLQEEIKLQLSKKIKIWLGILSLPIVFELIKYLTGLVRSFF